MGLALTIIPLALLIFALVDLIGTNDSEVKHLPKIAWVFIIILLPLAGSIVWLIVGKERGQRSGNIAFGDPRRHEAVQAQRTLSTEEELAKIEREIAFHEREARIQRLEAQLKLRTTDGSAN